MQTIKSIHRNLKTGLTVIFISLSATVGSANQFSNETDSLGPKQLRVGDTVPDLVFSSMINHPSNTARLSDFENKALILDFWATWCIPCVASFPKLVTMQEKFSDDLKILPLSNDPQQSLQRFYDNNPLSLPTAYLSSDDVINRYFPHREVPHYVWISKDRTVYAITNGSRVTDENIRMFLSGQPSQDMEQKDDSLLIEPPTGKIVDSIETLGPFRTISLDSNILFQSVISKYDSRVTQGGSFTRKGYKNRFLSFNNYSIADLFLTAYYGFTRGGNWDKLLIDIDDSTLVYPDYSNQEKFLKWQRQHSYSYRLVLPEDKANKEYLYQRMQKDLTDFFGIQAQFEDHLVNCLVLKTVNASKARNLGTKGREPNVYHSVFKISLTNQPVETLLDVLNKYGINSNKNKDFRRPQLEFINETGITGEIDLHLGFSNMKDFEELNEKLASVGLHLEAGKRTRRVLVLSKPGS